MTPWGDAISPVGDRPRRTVLLRSCAVAIQDLDQTVAFRAVHALALRGSLPELPEAGEQLVADGLVRASPAGFTLTKLGNRRSESI
jgi:hypothetical protein